MAGMDFSRPITRWAGQRPGLPAIRFGDAVIDYRELARRVDATQSALAAHGVRRGDRVAWLGLNHPLMLVLLFALCRIGAMLAPLNIRLSAAEHARQLADCTPRLLLHDASLARHLTDIGLRTTVPVTQPVEPFWDATGDAAPDRMASRPQSSGTLDDDLLLVYTSGTSGEPKGVVLTQNAVLFNCINALHAHDLTAADHGLIALPLFHVGGLSILTLPLLYAGAQVTLHRRFEAGRVLADIAARRPTLTALVPAMIAAVIAEPAWPGTDLSSLRMINTGSSLVPLSLIDAWHRRGVPVGQVYGATETGPIALCLRAEDAVRKAGAAGYPAMHCDVALFADDGRRVAPGETGEIRIRGPNLMRGYFANATATADAFADGWYRTGDLARQDEDGCYWVVGRSRDMIISGGENIFPAELEAILADSPAVADAAVVGVPDPRWGEVPVAAVVPAPGTRPDEAQVLALFDGRLARYKHPKRVVFVPALPRTALGKVRKSELAALLAAGGHAEPPSGGGAG